MAQCSYFLKVFRVKMFVFCSYFLSNILACYQRILRLSLIILLNFFLPRKSYAIFCVPNATFSVWLKDNFDRLQLIILQIIFSEKYKSSLFYIFAFELPSPKMLCFELVSFFYKFEPCCYYKFCSCKKSVSGAFGKNI